MSYVSGSVCFSEYFTLYIEESVQETRKLSLILRKVSFLTSVHVYCLWAVQIIQIGTKTRQFDCV